MGNNKRYNHSDKIVMNTRLLSSFCVHSRMQYFHTLYILYPAKCLSVSIGGECKFSHFFKYRTNVFFQMNTVDRDNSFSI